MKTAKQRIESRLTKAVKEVAQEYLDDELQTLIHEKEFLHIEDYEVNVQVKIKYSKEAAK